MNIDTTSIATRVSGQLLVGDEVTDIPVLIEKALNWFVLETLTMNKNRINNGFLAS